MSKKKDTADAPADNHMHKEILGLIWLALGIFLLICLLSYSSKDPSFNNNLNPKQINNLVGVFGSHLSDLLYQCFGLTALLWPAGCLHLAWRWLKFKEVRFRLARLIAFLLLQVSLGGLLALELSKVNIFGSYINEAGGAVGRILVQLLARYLNIGGAAIILSVFFLVALILSTRFSLVLFIDGILERFGRRLELRHEAKQAKTELRQKEKKQIEIKAPPISEEPKRITEIKTLKPKKKSKAAEEVNQETFSFLDASGTYHMPGITLLDHDGGEPKPIDRDSLTMAARMLEKKLLDFGVEGDVVEVKPGPVVTMYEFAPAPGVKVNKISNLQDDLAMALQAVSIRIVAPIPGRGVVGIEIPNKDRETVYLKEIIDSDDFQRNGGKLPMALGKDIFGQVVCSDLAKMPHLLVAGSTGSGKSVSINTMILSLLYRGTPEDVRLIMIDPKMLELSIYEGIPHLLLPVVTNPKKASLALAWAVREMERRYKLMADKSVRNIDGYNRKLAKEQKEAEDLPPVPESEELLDDAFADMPLPVPEPEEVLEHGHLPYIVVIVDELADLMMVAGREIEESIARLAQMARAAGIHLILATQRPSVDVITGLIKANFPTRISFKVFSRTDSRTILDSMGAEALLGMGDMLFLPPGVGYLQRVHGAFVSELEVQRVVDFLSKQGQPEYDKTILQAPPASGSENGEEEEYDERWDEALKIVTDTRQASISMLQRRLRVGYNRAARMIERMEMEGIVGPSDGSGKPREVLARKIE